MPDLIDSIRDDLASLTGNSEEIWCDSLAVLEKELSSRITETSPAEQDDALRVQLLDFMHRLSNGFGIEVHSDDNLPPETRIEGLRDQRTRIKSDALINSMIARNSPDPLDVTLSLNARDRVQHLSRKLRDEIHGFDIEDKKKLLLLTKLDEFDKQLLKDGVKIAEALKAIALVGGALVGLTAVLADAPDAANTFGQITASLGFEAAKVDEVLMVEMDEPQLMLPPPEGENTSQSGSANGAEGKK